jgi:AraC family transcriptional regulator
VATGLPNLAKFDYVDRVNRAIDHIVRHLAEPLRLEQVARAACFSPYHFHRIFAALMGETVHAFVKRVRLERALYLMSHRPNLSLTEVALECGFSSSSDFSRAFRGRYGVAPRSLDVDRVRRDGREQMLRHQVPQQPHRLAGLPAGENPDGFTVRLRRVPARRVAYVRVFRPYEGGVPAAAAQLVAWAEARGLADGQWLGYQWEDPDIVPLEQCRYDVGLEIPADAAVDGDVGVTTFPAMTLAEIDIAGSVELELRALDWLYKTWLPTSGYAPDHQPGFEAWHGRPFADGMDHARFTVQLAVVAADRLWSGHHDEQQQGM